MALLRLVSLETLSSTSGSSHLTIELLRGDGVGEIG